MHVAVAIVGFRNADDIARCLEALARSDHADFEVIICENGGPTGWEALQAVAPASLAGSQPVRAVLAEGNLGYAGGVNRCLQETRGADAWWVLNPDTQPKPSAMSALVRRLEEGDCDAVGCTLQLPNGKIQSRGGQWLPWLARAVSIDHGAPWEEQAMAGAVEQRQNYLSGASMMVARSFVDRAGLMREEYFLYCEEVEWCLRGIAIGLRLGYTPDAVVLHHQGTTTGNHPDIRQRGRTPVYLDVRNSMLLTRDLFPKRLPVAAIAAMVLIILRYGKRGAWRQLGYGLQGWAAGVLNRRGRPAWIGD
jgi:GT2 family glycosyltransferase